jgi:hypothetical protein
MILEEGFDEVEVKDLLQEYEVVCHGVDDMNTGRAISGFTNFTEINLSTGSQYRLRKEKESELTGDASITL